MTDLVLEMESVTLPLPRDPVLETPTHKSLWHSNHVGLSG